jgi:hypothetical protein
MPFPEALPRAVKPYERLRENSCQAGNRIVQEFPDGNEIRSGNHQTMLDTGGCRQTAGVESLAAASARVGS